MERGRGEVTSVEVDLRVGGSWRYVMMANEGFDVAFHGEFREIVPNERLVTTEVYDTGPGSEYADEAMAPVITIRSPRPMVARPSQLTDCPSAEVRDMIVASGWKPACRSRWTGSSRSRSRSPDPSGANDSVVRRVAAERDRR